MLLLLARSRDPLEKPMSNRSRKPAEAAGGLLISRRAFLLYGGTAVAVASLPIGCGTNIDPSSLKITFSIAVQRPEDLIDLVFGFVNFAPMAGDPRLLSRLGSGLGL